jgi:hypothetical protein
MKFFSAILLAVICLMGFSACRLLHLGGNREQASGCPVNAKNAGAEKLLSGDPKTAKAIKKAGKYKMTKDLGG